MTLNSRNRLMKWYSLGSLLLLVVCGALFIHHVVVKEPLNLPYTELNLMPTSARDFFSSLFTDYSYASLASITILAIYVPLVCWIISYVFEKTQSPEVLYFLGFLIGCHTEIFRFLIPLFNLWSGYSSGLILIGKVVFAGRLLTVMSLMFSSIFSSDDKIQEADKNLLIALTISMFFSYTVAIDTRSIHESIMVNTVFQNSFAIMRICLVVMTIISFILKGRKKNVVPYIILIAGYTIMIQTSTLGGAFAGMVMFISGTKYYFQTLHNYYLWK